MDTKIFFDPQFRYLTIPMSEFEEFSKKLSSYKLTNFQCKEEFCFFSVSCDIVKSRNLFGDLEIPLNAFPDGEDRTSEETYKHGNGTFKITAEEMLIDLEVSPEDLGLPKIYKNICQVGVFPSNEIYNNKWVIGSHYLEKHYFVYDARGITLPFKE